MAISLEIIEISTPTRLPSLILPPQRRTLVEAEGATELLPHSAGILLRNHGDEVLFRVGLQDDATEAAADDDKTVLLRADEDLPFFIPASSTGWQIDVRAVI